VLKEKDKGLTGKGKHSGKKTEGERVDAKLPNISGGRKKSSIHARTKKGSDESGKAQVS